MTTDVEKFFQLIKENPDLQIIPRIDEDAWWPSIWWMGRFGRSELTGYYMGRDYIHLMDEDEEDVLSDMVGCKHHCAPDGRDIGELTEEERSALYRSIPWTKVIVVYITT